MSGKEDSDIYFVYILYYMLVLLFIQLSILGQPRGSRNPLLRSSVYCLLVAEIFLLRFMDEGEHLAPSIMSTDQW